MQYHIETIDVYITLNTPELVETPFPLTSDLIYIPKAERISESKSTLSKKPFFTKDVQYDLKECMKMSNYEKIVRFFFDKKYFQKNLGVYGKVTTLMREKDIIDNNIRVMMLLLFPTSFPMDNNYDTSFRKYIARETFSLSDIASMEVRPYKPFSYLKKSGTVYTVTKITWLNDLFNHPKYRSFVEDYIAYKNWADKEVLNIQVEILKQLFKMVLSPTSDIAKENKQFIESVKEYIDVKTSGDNITVQKFQSKPESKPDEKYSKDNDDYQVLKQFTESIYACSREINSIKTLMRQSKKNEETEETEEALAKRVPSIISELTSNPKEGTNSTRIKDYMSKFESLVENVFAIHKILEKSRSFIKLKISHNLETKLKAIYTQVQSINSLVIISEKYITDKDIMIDYEQDPDIKRIVESKYSNFVHFVKKIRDFIRPTRVSNNENLQTAIQQFSESNTHSLISIAEYIKYNFILMQKKGGIIDINLLNTGINLIHLNQVEGSKYEIYVTMDVIEGEVNQENKSDVFCKYQNLNLGNMMERQVLGKYSIYEAKNDTVFFSLQSELKKARKPVPPEKVKPKPPNKPNPIKRENQRGTKGGWKKRHSYHHTCKRRL